MTITTATELHPSLWGPTTAVLVDVWNERDRQQQKFGQQNHPDGTGPDVLFLAGNMASPLGTPLDAAVIERTARLVTDHRMSTGAVTYADILTEEWAEAIAQPDPLELRIELIQVAAVAVAWVEKLDRETMAEVFDAIATDEEREAAGR